MSDKEDYSVTSTMIKECRDDFINLANKYKKLVKFVETIARLDLTEQEVQAGFLENIGTLQNAYFARELLKEIGE